ncbi:hypothetical protein CPT_Muldoon_072 [Serratia phage Muldoon]|uniref:Uncharacterized protein n=1 Tax=Serratia phage Muldoon TaxID=2601678 RepID=A0A5P8PH32_9CAUD|nr:hypothetical protein HYP94_gp071 [Serratia phage Muldoon]QFR56028.1 hypothetical protein CPT_Muldoon_072 [Serratia phage Muldoon]
MTPGISYMKPGIWYRFKSLDDYDSFRKRASINDAIAPFLAGGFKVLSAKRNAGQFCAGMQAGVTGVHLVNEEASRNLETLFHGAGVGNIMIAPPEFVFFEEIPGMPAKIVDEKPTVENMICELMSNGVSFKLGDKLFRAPGEFIEAIHREYGKRDIQAQIDEMVKRHAKELAELTEKLK